MPEKISDYISKNSFSRDDYKILIRNETSQTQFTKSEQVLIKKLSENGLTLELPQNICQKGHNLTLFFLSSETELKNRLPNSGPLKEAAFDVVAKIDKIESIASNERVLVEVTFLQYQSVKWKKILEFYSNNQDKINSLISGQHIIRDKNE